MLGLKMHKNRCDAECATLLLFINTASSLDGEVQKDARKPGADTFSHTLANIYSVLKKRHCGKCSR